MCTDIKWRSIVLKNKDDKFGGDMAAKGGDGKSLGAGGHVQRTVYTYQNYH